MFTSAGGREYYGRFRSRPAGERVVPAHDVEVVGLDMLPGNRPVVITVRRGRV